MAKDYYGQRELVTPEYRAMHMPEINTLNSVNRLDMAIMFKASEKQKKLEDMCFDEMIEATENKGELQNIFLERGINPNTEISPEEMELMEFNAYYCGVGKKPENLTEQRKNELERKLGFNTSPTKAQKLRAAMCYSNILQDFYRTENTPLTDLDGITKQEGKMHNNIAEISALTGIKASTIKYWARTLEKDSNVQSLKIERYGRTFNDLTDKEKLSIYVDKRSNNFSPEELREKHNLRSNYVVRKVSSEVSKTNPGLLKKCDDFLETSESQEDSYLQPLQLVKQTSYPTLTLVG